MNKCSDRIYESWDSRKADLWELLERIRRGSDKAMTEMLEYPEFFIKIRRNWKKCQENREFFARGHLTVME